MLQSHVNLLQGILNQQTWCKLFQQAPSTICYAISGAHDTVSDLFERHCYKSDTFNNLQQAARKQLLKTL